jgi:hypothetical protein
MKCRVQDIETGQINEWTLAQVLEEINRDRSEEWESYDEKDWREGWDFWVEGDYYTLLDTGVENVG